MSWVQPYIFIYDHDPTTTLPVPRAGHALQAFAADVGQGAWELRWLARGQNALTSLENSRSLFMPQSHCDRFYRTLQTMRVRPGLP